jgi:hypothetical protein
MEYIPLWIAQTRKSAMLSVSQPKHMFSFEGTSNRKHVLWLTDWLADRLTE